MKAMILAAGLGTRLRPLTDDRPKALVEIAGHTLLELALRRLRAFGIHDVIVNTHHYAEMIAAYLQANGNFGMRIAISHEDTLLDTGGGLRNAAWFFRESTPENNQPFLLHNVDVISTIDFTSMLRFHAAHSALATLAVQHRDTARPLLFDDQGILCGRRVGRDAEPEMIRPVDNPQPLAFSGIHVISPALLPKIRQQGIFSIIPAYLDLAASGENIMAFRADEYYWRDLGRPENIAQAASDLKQGIFSID